MTYSEFKAYALNYLPDSTSAAHEADILIQHFGRMKRSDMLINRSVNIPKDKLSLLLDAVCRRSNGEPLQYIIGEWEFYGLRIFCGEGCLIPRPETELIAEYAIKRIPKNGHFLDLCTGSGCISLAVLNNRPDVTGCAVDISPKALEYTRKNAIYHNLENRLEIVQSDVLDFVPLRIPDVIISNPPYIKTPDLEKLAKELYYEPREALDGGHDGLDFYKIISSRYRSRFLSDSGCVIFEVGYDISDEVAALMRHYGFDSNIVKDIFGVDRMVIGERKAEFKLF